MNTARIGSGVYPHDDRKEMSFLTLWADQDIPIWETAPQLAENIEHAYYSGDTAALEWIQWFDPDAREMRPARLAYAGDPSTQYDERDGAPVWNHYQIVVRSHSGRVLATANYSIDLDA